METKNEIKQRSIDCRVCSLAASSLVCTRSRSSSSSSSSLLFDTNQWQCNAGCSAEPQYASFPGTRQSIHRFRSHLARYGTDKKPIRGSSCGRCVPGEECG